MLLLHEAEEKREKKIIKVPAIRFHVLEHTSTILQIIEVCEILLLLLLLLNILGPVYNFSCVLNGTKLSIIMRFDGKL